MNIRWSYALGPELCSSSVATVLKSTSFSTYSVALDARNGLDIGASMYGSSSADGRQHVTGQAPKLADQHFDAHVRRLPYGVTE